MPQLQETFHVWACILAQILQNFLRSPLALLGSAFHKALEPYRAMFAREVNGSLAHALVAAEAGALSHLPAGVAAEKIGIAQRVAQRGPAGVVGADAGEDTLQLLQTVVGVALNYRRCASGGIGHRWRISGPSMPAGIINKQPA